MSKQSSLADCHTHTCYSSDSATPVRRQIEEAIRLNLPVLCITDHMDMDYPEKYNDPFVFDADAYFKELVPLASEYKEQIQLLIGVELGLQPHLGRRLEKFTAAWPFDYVIGSVHIVNSMDPYEDEFWRNRSFTEGCTCYFESVLKNISLYDCFDSLGHLDYIVRYGPRPQSPVTFQDFPEIIDEILKLIIRKGKALECNTAGYKYGLLAPNPHPSILKRYRQLGGTLLTIGSDGHKPEHLGYDFAKARELLKECGFKEYTVYQKRQPVFFSL